ncbi:MAG: peptidoglycan-binding protein [bacterium]
MNKKIFLSLLLLIVIPLVGFAQQADVDPQGDSLCVSIFNNLRYRATDANTNAEVSVLQDFLQAGGYLKSNPVGFFGIMTTAAVKKFQKENNISPTGYVGPITRQKIKDQSCSTSSDVVFPVAPKIPTSTTPIVNRTPTQTPVTPPVTSTTISLLSPNGGEKLVSGSAIPITWSLLPAKNEGLSIYYITEENYQKSIIGSQKTIPSSAVYLGKSTSGYYWQIPTNLSGAYRILLAYTPSVQGNSSIASYIDYSDSYFKIAPPPVANTPTTSFINVISPNGGEVIKQGSVVRIKWNAPGIDSVYIKLRKGNDTYHNPNPDYNSYEASIALRVNANEGYFDWKVPTSLPDGKDYAIRVLDLNGGNISDDSNGYFTISSGTSIGDFGLLSVKSDKAIVNSGDKVTLSFAINDEVGIFSKMLMYCPSGVTSSFGTSGKDLCNVWRDFPMTPSTAEVIFRNTNSTPQTVVPNFYEYKINDSSYMHGKVTSIVVNPVI